MTETPTLPERGGSYLRREDGTLERAGETPGKPAVKPPVKPAKKEA